jgi:hypothetical protein
MKDMVQEVIKSFSIREQQCIRRNGPHLTSLIFKNWHTSQKCFSNKKGKVPVLNYAPRNEDVLEEWRYSSTDSWPRHSMEESGQLHAPAALPLGKESPVPMDRKLGWPQSRSEHGGKEKNSQPPPGIKPQNTDRPGSSLLAMPTELSRFILSYFTLK